MAKRRRRAGTEYLFLVVLICAVAIAAGLIAIYVMEQDTSYKQQQRMGQESTFQATQNAILQSQLRAYEEQLRNAEAQQQQAKQAEVKKVQVKTVYEPIYDVGPQYYSEQDIYDYTNYDEYYYYHSLRTGNSDLTVRVKDEDGDAIDGAKVAIDNSEEDSDYTDEDGKARFSNIENDCYSVRASKSGYVTEDHNVCIHDDKQVTFVLEEK